MDVICRLNRTQDPHPSYHEIARQMGRHWKLHQVFLMVRRFFSGWLRNELSFWVYAGGEISDRYGDNRPGAIVEIALTKSNFLQLLEKEERGDTQIDWDPVLKDKLFMACAPASDIAHQMSGLRIVDDRHDIIGFLLVPRSSSNVFNAGETEILKRTVRVAFERSSSAYAESEQLQTSLSAIAQQLFRILSEASSTEAAPAPEPATDDVLQEFLDYTRTTMNAQKCALFLVSDQGNSLTLERISEQRDTENKLHYDQIPHIPSYDLTHYDPTKPKQGVTPWVLHRKKPFNARSYEELLGSSEGHHKGNWDAFIYGGTDNARHDFKCVYMTPLLAGEKAVGVLKCENRTPDARYPFFDQIDERQINVMAGVLANLVVSQRIERRRYDRALPAISEILLRDFGQPKLFKSLLRECRRLLHADLCSLFVVTDRADLSLRAIVGLDEAKENLLGVFKYPDYRKSDGLTCLVLQQRKSFNIRSYQDLADRSERKGPGKWDDIVYDGDAAVKFKSLYSIPLRIGEEDIGVLKVENKNVPPFYFTESDERLLDLIGRLIAIGVKYDNEAYLGLMLRAAEMGFLASGIAHEFNTYLQGIGAIASRIGQRADDPGVRVLVHDLSKQIELSAQAILNFRMIRDRKQEVETFVVDQMVDQITAIVGERFKDNNVQLDYEKSGMEVTMNPSEFQTILINLLRNAHDAIAEMKRPGKVALRLTPAGRGRFVIEVTDNGKGIDSEIKDYLCAPYFSTKPPGGGMGMGLFWIRRIVERNSGKIDFAVKNQWGGATFSVTLPIKPTEH
jgi:signal transduction histidine kinase